MIPHPPSSWPAPLVRIALGCALVTLASCGGKSRSTGFVPETRTAKIGSTVWHDLSCDGFRDSNEPGIVGAGVRLTGTTASGDPVDRSKTTEAGGTYLFDGLEAGDYTVEVVSIPSRFFPTKSNAGGDPRFDSNGSPAKVSVVPGEQDLTIDFGYCTKCTGVIGDFVWRDLNGDGKQNPDEMDEGIEGIGIVLKDASGATTRTVTDADGAYSFTGLCKGTYTVEIDASTVGPCVVLTKANVGSDRKRDSNPSPSTVELASDDAEDASVDFGFRSDAHGVIGDYVWNDANENGLQDGSTEMGIPGVKIILEDAKGKTWTTTTNNRGAYRFPQLCDGKYTVRYDPDSLPPCFGPTKTLVGSNRAIDSNPSPSTVELKSGRRTDDTIDFGFISEGKGLIGDYVWDDKNENGLQDKKECGMMGIVVRLLDDQGDEICRTKTDSDGCYVFTGLCAGDYMVEVVESSLPPCFVASPCERGSNRAKDSNCSPAEVTLATNTSEDETIDFGFYSNKTAFVGDLVWHDKNCDGLQSRDEPGLRNVKVLLQNSRNKVIAWTRTNSHGRYLFRGLCPGEYTVSIYTRTLPKGFKPSPCNVGKDDRIDSECSPVKVKLPGSSGFGWTVDFGFCKKETEGKPGCSPGFWKQSKHFRYWPRAYAPSTKFAKVFDDAFKGKSLVEVLSTGGGGLDALGRQTVAALLNAATHKWYPLSPEKVIKLFNYAYPGSRWRYECLKRFFEKLNKCKDD